MFLFDIGTNVTFPDAAVRVVTDLNNSCKLEEFFIGDSDTDENALAASLHSSVYSSEVDWTSVTSWFQPEIGQSGPLEISDSFALYETCRFSAACSPRSFSDTNWMPLSRRVKRHEPQIV